MDTFIKQVVCSGHFSVSSNEEISVEQGDRTGHLHIGHNQTLYIGDGRLPLDLDVYHGGQVTLQGELRVAGVTARIQGVVNNVENLTIADGGVSLADC